MRPKVIILFSSKSSGSSAFQKYLITQFGVKVLEVTPHHENETLFWTKAASCLGLPQNKMHRSVVPYSMDQGRRMLSKMLRINGLRDLDDPITKHQIFDAFYEMVCKYQPVFFEKSPHHLFNISNVELILECRQYLLGKVDFHLVGVVRSPMDTIYSAWRRWGYNCSSFESEWYETYKNLEMLKHKEKSITIFRYEDFVINPSIIDAWYKSINLSESKGTFKLSRQSVNKWRRDVNFGHKLKVNSLELAQRFGYGIDDLKNESTFWNSTLWIIKKIASSVVYRLRRFKSLISSFVKISAPK